MNPREVVIAKLQQLSPTSLQTVDELIDSLIAQQHHQDVKAQSSDTLTKKWEAWFAEVEELEVSPRPLSGDYPQHLLHKYRQQGLEL